MKTAVTPKCFGIVVGTTGAIVCTGLLPEKSVPELGTLLLIIGSGFFTAMSSAATFCLQDVRRHASKSKKTGGQK